MNTERKSLNLGELEEFSPRTKVPLHPKSSSKAVDNAAAFPSRERLDDAQINIKAPNAIIRHFRQLARKERYRHGEFLEVLMSAYENKQSD